MSNTFDNKNLLKLLSGMDEAASSKPEDKMKKAIETGFHTEDPEVQMKWAELFGTDELPDMETFIRTIALSVKHETN